MIDSNSSESEQSNLKKKKIKKSFMKYILMIILKIIEKKLIPRRIIRFFVQSYDCIYIIFYKIVIVVFRRMVGSSRFGARTRECQKFLRHDPI